MKTSFLTIGSALLFAASTLTSPAQLLWTVGVNDDGWPAGDGGGPNATFVQENGSINALPGNPASPEANGQADNDYYFAGSYTTAISSVTDLYGIYTPLGDVLVNEEAAERAFAGGDLDLRYHFNLADTLQPTDLVSITFDALNLDTSGSDPRFGIEVYFNGVLVQSEIVIRPAQTGKAYTTPQFTLESVNAQVGPGFDNIVSLKGISYNDAGGGSWMGIDYVQLSTSTVLLPPAVFPWAVGLNDGGHPVGDGGGANTSFVQENGVENPLPGSPTSPEIDLQADNDYYFAGVFDTTVASVVASYGDYTPVGLVPVNEEAAERGFSGTDNDLRYHFNLPNALAPDQKVSISFDALSLDETASASTRRYGVEIYFNGVLVQPQVIIRPGQLGRTFTTPPFSLGSVNAAVGSGFDNIVSIRGINYSADGGGNSLGIDYVQFDVSTVVIPPPVLPWSVGMDDNDWPFGSGGGINANFVQETGDSNPLPGSSFSEPFDGAADDDYYFAGAYTTVVAGNGSYVPLGLVPENEDATERGFGGTDNDLRFHFNLPSSLKPVSLLMVTYEPRFLDTAGADPRYGVEVYVNGVLVQAETLIRPAQLGQAVTTAPFTLATVNAEVGPGFDNIVTLKGINYGAEGGGNSIGFDYVKLAPLAQITFPWAVGRDDNGWPAGNGGGANATFVQEAGTNPLPGNPASPEINQQADDDYYFSGEYTTAIDSVLAAFGNYTPVGVVIANEEAAERAFAGTDNDLRYHFNLPDSLQQDDLLAVTFDANNLHTDGQADPRYGVEVYFNGVLVQSEIVIRPTELDVDYTTAGFTLASVNARTGLGSDNIVSLRGINYNAEGGGNWMGIDYVQLNQVQLKFLAPVVNSGAVTLDWTGIGQLEWAPKVIGPWTPVSPAPEPPYTEFLTIGENRFYRLRK